MPTSILVSVHLLIEQVLNCLERMLERCASERRLEIAPARDAIDFTDGVVTIEHGPAFGGEDVRGA